MEAVSHLDVFQRGVSLKWCAGYAITPPLLPWPSYVERLPFDTRVDLDRQRSLTHLLNNACPQYRAAPVGSVPDFLDRISGVTALPVAFGSYGPTWADVQRK